MKSNYLVRLSVYLTQYWKKLDCIWFLDEVLYFLPGTEED